MSFKVDDRCRYSENHEWIRLEGDIATTGISDHAQDQLSDIVYVELPEPGDSFAKGDVYAVVESVKAAADCYMPVSGDVVEVNEQLEDSPQTANEDPYGSGTTYGYALRNEPGEREIYIVWSRKEPGVPVLYGDDRVYLYGVTIYATNASRIATTVDEIECALGRGPASARTIAGSLLPLALLLLFLLTRRKLGIKEPCH